MSSEWETISLGDCIELTTGFPFKSLEYSDSINAVRLLRGDNIGQGTLRWDGVKKWPADKANGLEDYELREADIVLAMDRPWIPAGLKFGRVRKSDLPALLVQRVARLRPTQRINGDYLFSVLASNKFSEYIQNVTTGTAVPHISAKQIRSYCFQLPPADIQERIGKFHATLDGRITLLSETNKTLESIAQTIFKSWFVDFDPVRAKMEGRQPEGMDEETAALFPDSFEESELGLIPRGWQKKSLDAVASYLNGLALQKFPPTGKNDLPVVKIAQLRKGGTNDADLASGAIKPEYIVRDGDILFSWSGSLEVEVWCGGIGALNQHLFKVTSNEYPKWFYFLWTKHHLPSFRKIAAGKATTMGHIQRKHLSSAAATVPPANLMDEASKVFVPLIDLQIENSLRVRSLSAIRDTLLPRLISGQLSMSDRSLGAAVISD